MKLFSVSVPSDKICDKLRRYFVDHLNTRGGRIIASELPKYSAVSLVGKVFVFFIILLCCSILFLTNFSVWWLTTLCIFIAVYCIFQLLHGLKVNLRDYVEDGVSKGVNEDILVAISNDAKSRVSNMVTTLQVVGLVITVIVYIIAKN